MSNLTTSKIFKFNPNTVGDIRKMYELDKPGRMEEAVELLSDWVKKQNHFVKKDFSKQYLERVIIAAKGSVERAKTRLDKVCTFKTLMPQFFGDYNAREDFSHIMGKIAHVVLPKMTPNHDRVIVSKHVGKDYTAKMILDAYRSCIMIGEYLRANDYAASYHFVIDFRDGSVTDYIANLDVMNLRQLILIGMEGYGLRVKAIHLLTDSKFINILISIAKQVLSEKISSRISVCKNLEELHKALPKHILPEDLGGMEKSTEALHEDLIDELSSKDFRSYWLEMTRACSDESRRETNRFQEEYMGMPGSFRKLSVD